jgi:hypothetical protein
MFVVYRKLSRGAVSVLLLVALIGFAPGARAVYAQPASCQFVLGFAELAARIGEAVVGACLENQRTITGPETFNVSSKTSLELYAGHAVQRTTTGVLAWSPNDGITSFYDEMGIRSLGPRGYVVTAWEELLPPSGTSPAPAPRQRADREVAQERCSEIWTNALVRSIGMSEVEMSRRKAEADAIYSLCGRAADDDGTRGVTCFTKAWEASLGMERVFAGSGRQAYEDAYRRCITGR